MDDPQPAHETMAGATRARRPRLRFLRFALVAGIVVGAVAYTALVVCSRLEWLADMAASFRPQAALGLCVAAFVVLALRAWIAAGVTAACALFLAAPWLLVTLAPRPSAEPGVELRLVTANVFMGNSDPDGFRAWLAHEAPDVLALQEWPSRWRESLHDLDDVYPHGIVFPERSDTRSATWFGIALFTRLPVVSQRAVHFADGEMPVLEMVVEHGGARWTIRAIHALAPASRTLWRRRNTFLERLAREMIWDERTILVGDFNTSSGSGAWRDLVARIGLADSRPGFGWQASWATDQKIRGIPTDLDHVLVGSAIRVRDRSLTNVPGSDHRGVVVRLAPR